MIRTCVEITEAAEKAYKVLAARYGIKTSVSAGLLLLDQLTPAEREIVIDAANAVKPVKPKSSKK